jgi:hypothetical protein
LAKDDRPGSSASRTSLIHCGRSYAVSWVSIVGNVRRSGHERGGVEFGAAFQQGLELGLLVFGQGVRMAGEPTGDLPDGRRRRCERRFAGAVLLKVVTDGRVAAGVAGRADLPEQLGGVAAAFLRALDGGEHGQGDDAIAVHGPFGPQASRWGSRLSSDSRLVRTGRPPKDTVPSP